MKLKDCRDLECRRVEIKDVGGNVACGRVHFIYKTGKDGTYLCYACLENVKKEYIELCEDDIVSIEPLESEIAPIREYVGKCVRLRTIDGTDYEGVPKLGKTPNGADTLVFDIDNGERNDVEQYEIKYIDVFEGVSCASRSFHCVIDESGEMTELALKRFFGLRPEQSFDEFDDSDL